jgi:hypothetical protein
MAKVIRAVVITLFAVGIIAALPGIAAAHEERQTTSPDGTGSVPVYRETGGTEILVCKTDPDDFAERIAGFPTELRDRNQQLFATCRQDGVRHLQEAVDRAQPGDRILILPGRYQEEPSLAPPTEQCADLVAPRAQLGYQILSYDQQVECPHEQNLVAILGKRDLQIEGTGASPSDVVVDAQFNKLNAIRADRANGIYLRNFTAERTTFNAVYVIETDGFVIDKLVGRYNDEYGFLTFATDHGLYTDCEAYGNGDSGVYPGAASNINAGRKHDVDRYAIEIRNCDSHHNLLGYSGTAGNSVWAHDNDFHDNTAGVSMDSAFPDHPGLPQNHAKFERNRIYHNNVDYYDFIRNGTCAKPYAERGYEVGVVCPATGVPKGVGILTAGGNYNLFQQNWIYGNDYAAFMLFWVPSIVRGDDIDKFFDTSHYNRYIANQLGIAPDGSQQRNGLDFWWDGQGAGNCWQAATKDSSDPVLAPRCGSSWGSTRILGDPIKTLKLLHCAGFDQQARAVPRGCDWYGASGLWRIEVQILLGQALVFGLAGLLLLWRRVRRTRTVLIVSLAGGIGLALTVIGTGMMGTRLLGAGYLLIGIWLAVLGHRLRRDGGRALGALTWLLAIVTIIEGIDRAVVVVPFLPIQPGWVRLVLALIWVVWVLADPSRRSDEEDETAMNVDDLFAGEVESGASSRYE